MDQKVIHVVVSLDEDQDTIGIITVYYPSVEKFEKDLKTRKVHK